MLALNLDMNINPSLFAMNQFHLHQTIGDPLTQLGKSANIDSDATAAAANSELISATHKTRR